MTVKLIPGPRDEEKIAVILNARKNLSDEEYFEFIHKCFSDCYYYDEENAWFDAMYYAGGYGDDALKSQEKYFNWALLEEEDDYFINRLMGDID